MPAFNLSPAQRADLRAQAHALKPVVIIGADGLTEPVVAEARRALHSHQLIKIRVFGDDRDARVEIADTLCARLDAALVQHIGKLLVIWRPSDDAEDLIAAAPAARGRAAGPSSNAAMARRVAAAPANGRRPAVAPAPRGRAGATAGAAARSPARKTPARQATSAASAYATAAPRERARTRDAAADGAAPRSGKGGAPRMVTVVKPTGNDRRRARPTQVLVRGNERVTAGGNVKKAKRRVVSTKRMHQQDK
ncbi:MAG: YhbY family RNA-binding protein [Janthinobacterium lividum]